MTHQIVKKRENVRAGLLYGAAYICLSLLLLRTLSSYIRYAFFEQDLIWFIPTVVQSVEGLTFWNYLRFVFDPGPIMYGVPGLKVYALSILKLFGPIARYFIVTSLAFHFASSALLFSLSKKIGLSWRSSFCASMIYLTLFAHYGAYLWPMAAQHLLVIFFTLLVLNLYFTTERRIDEKRPYGIYYAGTLVANLAASFCKISIVILPLVIITHILFLSGGGKKTTNKYFRWLPLLATYLGFPLMLLTYVGDNRLNIYLGNTHSHIAYIVFGILILAGMIIIGMLGGRLAAFKISKKTGWTVGIFTALLFYAVLCACSIKNLLLPYNMIVPFVGTMTSFLMPFQNALCNDASRPYNFINLQLGVSAFLLALWLMYIYFKDVVPGKRSVLIFVPWYIMAAIYVNSRDPIASRYFIYLSPIFAVVAATVLERFIKSAIRGITLVLICLALCIPNAIATGFDAMRGKLANNFLIYDYIRTASVLKEASAKIAPHDIGPGTLYIDGILPISFEEYNFCQVDPLRYDNFKYALAAAFNDRVFLNTKVNTGSSKGSSALRYEVDGDKLRDGAGNPVGVFDKLFKKTLEKLEVEDYSSARLLLKAAIEKRPFLLNYLLSGLRLEDLVWLTNEPDLSAWVKRIASYYSCEHAERRRVDLIYKVLDGEITDYIQCLFFDSYLHYLSGDKEGAKNAFFIIRFLESDYGRLYNKLADIPIVKSNKGMLVFLKTFDSVSLYDDKGYRNIYAFERFLARLLVYAH